MAEKTYVLSGYHMGESAKAVKFDVHEIDGTPVNPTTTQWFPFSQVKAIVKNRGEELDTLTVKEWILEQKGLL